MEDNSEVLEQAEIEYIKDAIQSGIQSTEILNVLVLTSAIMKCLGELVAAMEKPDHVVYVVTPQTVQNIYTMEKAKILEIKNSLSGIIILNDNDKKIQ